MRILICGSLAYDTIMVFHGQFRQHILPEQLHILNVSFLVPDMRREYGGCAGNIAYNLRLLGADGLMMATVGDDFDPYLARLRHGGFDLAQIRRIAGSFTAQAFITTDLDDNQITAFHPGAMDYAHENRITQIADADVRLAIVAPDGRQGMIEHARDLAAAGIPFVFDPGQGLPMFDGDELQSFLALADYCVLNDYEAQLLAERTGLGIAECAEQVKALIITRGAAGSTILTQNEVLEIPAVTASQVADPTGCGDAYRAGLLYGIHHGWSWRQSGQLASLLGAIKITKRGGQNHKPSRTEICQQYQAAFGETLRLAE